MAKMFGILRSPFQGSEGRTAKQATRTGEEQLSSELNNVGRGDTTGGKTTVTTVLFEDGSGRVTVNRVNDGAVTLQWSHDAAEGLTYTTEVRDG